MSTGLAFMLEMARRKNIYRALHPLFLEPEIALPAESYDGVIATGVFTEGHAPPGALDGMLELARPGAFIMFTLSDLAGRDLGFDDRMAELSAAGSWRQRERTGPYRSFPFSQTQARVLIRFHVYQKSHAVES